MAFTAATLSIWLKSAENVEAVATFLESGDLKLVDYPGGCRILRTHSRDILKLEVGDAMILPATCD